MPDQFFPYKMFELHRKLMELIPDKTGDIVARPIEIVVKCLFMLLIVIDVKETQRTQNVFLSP